MATFDFISGDDFRSSLESDYREMAAAIDAKAWKAVHVLAGSIIEAVLVDYLIATDYQRRKSANPHKMTLDALIKACKDEGILGERAYNLSAAVKDYRNLIHPGRLIRLQETADENGAQVARALVEIIIADVAKTKQEKFGYTAEQVLTKLQHDSTALPYFEHILRQAQPAELERLLIVLPQRYLDYRLSETEDGFSAALSSLHQYFRPAFDRASDDVKSRTTHRFAKMIQEESQQVIDTYAECFFSPADMAYLSAEETTLVRTYWLSLLKRLTSRHQFSSHIGGLGPYLTVNDAKEFADVTVNMLIHEENLFEAEVFDRYGVYMVWHDSSPEAQKAMKARLELRAERLKSYEQNVDAQSVRELIEYLLEPNDDDLPF